MRGILVGALTVWLVITGVKPVQADAITITFASRDAFVLGTEQRDGDTMAVGTLSSHGESTATLESSYADPLHWHGRAITSITALEPTNLLSESTFLVGFTVAAPVTYTFEGSYGLFSTFPSPSLGFAETETSFSLRDQRTAFPSFIFRDSLSAEGGRGGNQSFSGLLMPGAYSMEAATSARASLAGPGNAAGNFAFTLDFAPAAAAPTPEPASLLLLGSGLAGLLRYRRRPAPEKS